MNKTKIPYGTHAWPVASGCTPISPSCDHCWAQTYLHRFHKPLTPTVNEAALNNPRFPRKPARILVGFQTDLWHEDVPWNIVNLIMLAAQKHPEHRFIFLTKRSTNLGMWADARASIVYPIPLNCWFGVTVESADYLHRIDDLLAANVPHRWVSVEPILMGMDTDRLVRPGIEWYVVGKENGSGARVYDPWWVQAVVNRCFADNVPIYVKPGTYGLDSTSPREYPSGLLLPGEANREGV